MAILTPQRTSSVLIKLILMGWSGTGKTSAIVPLAIPNVIKGWPGMTLRILDYDGKAEEIIRENLLARLDRAKAGRLRLTPITQEQHDAALANCDICVLRERTRVVRQGKTKVLGVTGVPVTWTKTMDQLEAWAKDWSPNHILITDSFTHMATIGIVNYTQHLQGKLNQQLSWTDYQEPQRLIRNFLTINADAPCNSIVCAHQEPQDIYRKTEETITKADGSTEQVEEVVESLMVPISVGAKGRVQIPSEFNHLLVMAKTATDERRVFTQPEDGVTTKSPYFARADKSYGIDVGLVEYFMLGR